MTSGSARTLISSIHARVALALVRGWRGLDGRGAVAFDSCHAASARTCRPRAWPARSCRTTDSGSRRRRRTGGLVRREHERALSLLRHVDAVRSVGRGRAGHGRVLAALDLDGGAS